MPGAAIVSHSTPSPDPPAPGLGEQVLSAFAGTVDGPGALAAGLASWPAVTATLTTLPGLAVSGWPWLPVARAGAPEVTTTAATITATTIVRTRITFRPNSSPQRKNPAGVAAADRRREIVHLYCASTLSTIVTG